MVRPSDQRGAAIVEAALVLPVLLAALLCLLQLLLIQQARLLTELAAYQAARAGIVRNGEPESMERAARFVLAPLACPTRVPLARALCRGGAARQAAGMAVLAALSENGLFPGVHVHVLSPHWPTHGALFSPEGELEFDRLDAPPELLEANLLTVQVQHWYELSIPFADAVLGEAYRAAAGGAPEGEELRRGRARPFRPEALAAARAAAATGRYFVPLVATHTMRMQSSFHARFVEGCACGEGRGCTDVCRAY